MSSFSPPRLVLWFLPLILFGCGGGGVDVAGDMDVVEEPTESFANAMLDLSMAIRVGRQETVRRSFTKELAATAWPVADNAERSDGPWILHHQWSLVVATTMMAREEFLAGLDEFLAHFRQIEDLRLKVKKSNLDETGSRLEASLALRLVGRDQSGRREWVRGWVEVSATLRDDGSWQVDRFKITDLDSMVAVRDIFEEVGDAAGLTWTAPAFLNRRGSPFAAYGAAAGDVNRDGLLDLVVASEDRNFLYLNRGDGSFEDVAESALIRTLSGEVVAPVLFDMDNDGDLDLFFSTIGEQTLLENRLVPDGRLEFWDISLESGVSRPAIGFSAVAGDVDGNGFTDVYVASYNRYGEVLPNRWDGATNGTANLLFLNRGGGTFLEAAALRGVADRRWSYAAGLVDIDRDGRLDIYVANDFGGANSLFINRGDHFEERAAEFGIDDRGYSMGVSFADYDNDGDLDLHVTRMSSTAGRRILARLADGELPARERLEAMAGGNALYRRTGSGFTEVSKEAGPFSAGWAWGGGFFDFDNDGWEDLFTPNGFISGSRLHDT